MGESKKKKETDDIKQKLEEYANLQRKIDNLMERMERMESVMASPSTPNLTGMPNGGSSGMNKIERQIAQKDELEEKIQRMIREERQLRKKLEKLIETLRNPDEQTIIEMRYIDRAKWWTICEALYSAEPDYNEKADKYLKRTFKLHGSALQALARLKKTDTIQK